MKIKTITKKTIGLFALIAFAVSSFGLTPAAQAATTWDVSGTYVINMVYSGTDNLHDLTLVQASDDTLSGSGGSPSLANVYTYSVNSGNVTNDAITLSATYTAGGDAVGTVLNLTGTIASNGTMSGTWSDNYQGGTRTGTWSTVSGAAELKPVADPTVTTNAATAITSTNATLNGTNGDQAGSGHSFWVSTSTFSTASPVLPSGVYSTADLGAIAANTAFSANLSSVSGLTIAPNTTYYFAAWVNVGGTWYPGEVMSFTTASDSTPGTVDVTIVKYVDGALATGTSANNTDFLINATWNADNIGAGSGQFSLTENGFGGDTTPYQAKTAEMTSGASYSINESLTESTTGASCAAGRPYALVGYTTGNTLAQAQTATISSTAPALTNITSDKYIIVWNDDCATTTPGGNIGGDVVPGTGVLAVTSIETLDSSAVADGTFENGWEYAFNITVPTDETDIAMKFSNWLQTGGSATIPAANNFRISSAQSTTPGQPILITAADTYSSPVLTMTGDLNPALDGLQVRVIVEARVPAGTPNGSYTTSYGVLSN